VQNLGNFHEILRILSSALGNTQKTFVGTLQWIKVFTQ